jgi:hypothetical protein
MIPAETLESIKDILARGRRMDAIALYRRATGASLADAQAAVRVLEAESRGALTATGTFSDRCPPRTSRKGRVLGWVSVTWGILFMLLGAGLSLSSFSYSFGGLATQGMVVKLTEDPMAHGNQRSWYPLVEYQVDGRAYTYKGVGSNPPRYTVGQKVPILYKPGRHDAARINSFFDLWLIPLVFGGSGSVFAVMGAQVLRHRGPQAD